MASVIKGKDVSMASVTVSPAKTLDNGAKLIYVNNKGGRFNIQTPPMDLAWDMNCYDEGPYPKYSCEVSFKGMDELESEDPVVKKRAKELKGFHDKMLELEEKLIDEGVKNGVSWFKLSKAKCNKDVIGSKFGPIIKVSKDKESGEPDGKWPSTMKLKLTCKDGKFACKLVDTDGDQYLVNKEDSGHHIEDILVKGARLKCIIQCVGLWVASGNYMCQWQLMRAEVEVPDAQMGDSFLPESDNEDNDESVTETPLLVDSDDEDEKPAPKEDSDSDSDSDEEEVVKTPPDTSPKKKPPTTIKRKKNASN